MSSRRIAVGEHGAITHARTPKGWVARTTYRGADGTLRNRQVSGRSKETAGRALHAVLTGPPKLAGEYVTGDSRIEQLAAAWLTEIRMVDEVGPETYDYYRRGVQTLICADDGIGNYRINELRPMAVKQFYQRILTTTGSDGQRCRTPSRPPWTHTVLSQMLRYAVEIGALDEARSETSTHRGAARTRSTSCRPRRSMTSAKPLPSTTTAPCLDPDAPINCWTSSTSWLAPVPASLKLLP